MTPGADFCLFVRLANGLLFSVLALSETPRMAFNSTIRWVNMTNYGVTRRCRLLLPAAALVEAAWGVSIASFPNGE